MLHHRRCEVLVLPGITHENAKAMHARLLRRQAPPYQEARAPVQRIGDLETKATSASRRYPPRPPARRPLGPGATTAPPAGSSDAFRGVRPRRQDHRDRSQLRHGDVVPREERVTLQELFKLVEDNYRLRRNRSIASMRYSFKHVLTFFGEKAKAVRLGHRIEDYVEHRRAEGASDATIRIELALLDRGLRLAVKKKLISSRSKPEIEKPTEGPNRMRKGFFSREQVEALCTHLPEVHADLVLFLFHANGKPVGDFRKVWRRACRAIGLEGRIRPRPPAERRQAPDRLGGGPPHHHGLQRAPHGEHASALPHHRPAGPPPRRRAGPGLQWDARGRDPAQISNSHTSATHGGRGAGTDRPSLS